MAGDDSSLSEVNLGIRELFRILVPGAYAILVAGSVFPDRNPLKALFDTNTRLATGILFLGLFGYALRIHECWWPFNIAFGRNINRLNDAIVKAIGLETDEEKDLKAPYKYFLTLGKNEFADRVHYFSSFYYMLITLSLYSFMAAISQALLAGFAEALTLELHWARWLAGIGLGVAGASQLTAMYATAAKDPKTQKKDAPKIQKKLGKSIEKLPFVALAFSLLVLSAPIAMEKGLLSTAELLLTRLGLFLVVVSFVFANLGNKQWQGIIDEQIVHVEKCWKPDAAPSV